MSRKLFCDLSPTTYRISVEKGILLRHLRDLFTGVRFARQRQQAPLPTLVYRHNSLIRRRLGNVNMLLQENKATNLALATPKVSGVLIRPGETFSLWKLIGRTSASRGYCEGLTIARGKPSQGIGGGLCQFSNLIHWMMLHSELTIVEHHHHDGVDLFPDYNRKIPFGTGTSITYNYLDYRVRNDTDNTYQLITYVDGEYLRGELRALRPQTYSFHIHVDGERFVREADGIYRCGTVVRDKTDRRTGRLVAQQTIRTNHAKIMYKLPEDKLTSTASDDYSHQATTPATPAT